MDTAATAQPETQCPFAVLYRDETLLAVHKPSGIAVHRSRRVGSGRVMLQALRDGIGRLIYPVHRLDRPTSGILLVALTPEAARGVCAQFREHRVRKTYLAVVRGWIEAAGRVDYPLRGSRGEARQPAETDFRRLACIELPLACGPYDTSRYSLVELQPQSGRQHQLRRHLKHIAHPIIGDTEYGDGRHNSLFRERFGIHRLLLQAVRLELLHPETGLPLRIECDPEPELISLFDDAGALPGPPGSAAGGAGPGSRGP